MKKAITIRMPEELWCIIERRLELEPKKSANEVICDIIRESECQDYLDKAT